ncbi:hypothetical protein RvY_03297 [Ramazzottius varieornatus]|uniref:Ig-like domain-containing protein n=1 Tax=Ramazzottius varieornatus TaxID=947166 RepID=A0A1D1UR05_RAMVA|nr:hypothetical protein RvY_03297 [Ramazzottius varieornatus]
MEDCLLFSWGRCAGGRLQRPIWVVGCSQRRLQMLFSLTMCLLACPPSSTVLALRITKNTACRPDAFTFCELPIITSLSEEPYPAFPGEEFKLPCQAYGSPPPHMAWYKVLSNGESLLLPTTPGHHLVNQEGTLKVKHVVPHDDGKYFCVATNSVGQAKFLVEIKVSHPMVALIPLLVSSTSVTLTWNGTVQVTSLPSDHPHHRGSPSTHPSQRHHHHVETRYRLSRHLLLRYRRFEDDTSQSAQVSATIKLPSTARQYTVMTLEVNTAYEFCIEFQPSHRPTTLLDCLTLRTSLPRSYSDNSANYYSQGHTILFLVLVVIVASIGSTCFGCYAIALGRKLWKHRSSRGFTSLGYSQDIQADYEVTQATNHDRYYGPIHGNGDPYLDDNPKQPLIVRI